MRSELPCDALTETTAARIGPAQGAYRKPSAPPTTRPDQNPFPAERAEAGEPRERCLDPVPERRHEQRDAEQRQHDDRSLARASVAHAASIDHRGEPDDGDR